MLRILSTLLVFMKISFVIASNSFEYGLICSGNFTYTHGEFNDSKSITSVPRQSLGLGGHICLNITRDIGLKFEMMYTSKGSQNGFRGEEREELKFHYLEMPLMIKYSFGKPYLLAGAYYSVLLSAQQFLASDDKIQLTDDFNSIDKGFVSGLGISVPLEGTQNCFLLEFQYLQGLSNIIHSELYKKNSLINHIFSLKVGFFF